MTRYRITIAGCDANIFEADLNEEEVKVLEKLSDLSDDNRSTDTEPVIRYENLEEIKF